MYKRRECIFESIYSKVTAKIQKRESSYYNIDSVID